VLTSQETGLLESLTNGNRYAVKETSDQGPCPVLHVIPLYSDCDTSLSAGAYRTLLNNKSMSVT